MRRELILSGLALVIGFAAWQAAPALQNSVAPAPIAALKPSTPIVPKSVALSSKGVTPMAERVATIGLLNKRNGLWRDLTLKPGEAIRIGDVVVRLRACETTAPWETDQYTGAFVQVITRGTNDKWRKIFSGWLYKETPSLNVVEHPIYDVWPKACQMRYPDIGPDTIVAQGEETASRSSPTPRSSRPKSTAPQADPVDDVADDSNEQ
jgi:hypothetical protein